METYKLRKPIDVDGVLIETINMDFDSLSGKDLERCEKQAKMLLGKGKSVQMTVPETNKTYLSCVAAMASGMKAHSILELGAKDYTQITLLVQGFLLDGESDLEEMETTPFTEYPED